MIDSVEIGKTYLVRSGWGYWDTTHYPIGGCFCRADRSGLPAVYITVRRKFPSCHGATLDGVTQDGRIVACGIDALCG